jgi:hypothetical protein
MKRWAIVDSGVVVNVTQGDQLDPAWIECDNNVTIGWGYDGAFVPPTAPSLTSTTPKWTDNLRPEYFWIDTGPWRDRFGIDWLAITASDSAICKAASALWVDRKYVNIKDPRNGQMIDALVALAQPTANPVFPGSGPITVEKKAVILNTITTEYERHIKGLQQPE